MNLTYNKSEWRWWESVATYVQKTNKKNNYKMFYWQDMNISGYLLGYFRLAIFTLCNWLKNADKENMICITVKYIFVSQIYCMNFF